MYMYLYNLHVQFHLLGVMLLLMTMIVEGIKLLPPRFALCVCGGGGGGSLWCGYGRCGCKEGIAILGPRRCVMVPAFHAVATC